MIIYAAVIGTGIGLKHVEAINNYKGSKVLYICEKNKNKIPKLKKIFPGVEILNNENEIFENKNINLVSIASYDNFHYKQIIKSIKIKKILLLKNLLFKKNLN
jgi:predicted dehydrogenase